MIRLRPRLLPLVLALLLPLLPGKAAAAPVPFDRALSLEWPLPESRVLRLSIRQETRPLAQVRLFTIEVTLLSSGRLVSRTVAALPSRDLHRPPPGPEPLVLPLPGALPLFLAALAGLVVVGRRRRTRPMLAAPDAPA